MSEEYHPIVAKGRNCWRIEQADKAAVVIDAADYYHVIAEAMEASKKSVFIVGWDFDTRIALDPEDSGAYKSSLGHFFLELVRESPERSLHILKWNFGALKQFTKPRAAYWLFRWWRDKRIKLKFDSAHPPGCSHHQKIVVIDDAIAACGGIDIAMRRWDTREHKPDNPDRTTPWGLPYDPWHDTTMLMAGPIASALGDLARTRWKSATRKTLEPVAADNDFWPERFPDPFEDVELAISRTRARHADLEEVRESEALVIDMIEASERFIYLENQYFTSPKVAAAICERLGKDDPPEIVMVMPRTGDGVLEAFFMDATRQRLMKSIQRTPGGENFRIYVPVNEAGTDIYVHAKLAIVDDRFLRVGSSNLNNRSMGLDSECDVTLDTHLPHNAGRDLERRITGIRHDLMAEHLGCEIEDVAREEEKGRGLIATIEALRGEGKTLTILEERDVGDIEGAMSEAEIADPESTEEMFEPFARKGLRQRYRERRERMRRRFSD